ncbi:hypothetical protein KSS87_021668 [Heliosperma pusillum]|nr:hypothetical protein KSS87_021668 [Heliosperma pusillum]
MPNGSFDRWLHGADGKMSLAVRVDIAIDVAHALNYLHHECETPIVHCDLKPSNILLDDDMVAHVWRFWISKSKVFYSLYIYKARFSCIYVSKHCQWVQMLEYGLGSKASKDGDIYSYGIVLLELMTGKSPTDSMFKDDYTLHMYAEATLPDQVLQIIDPLLEKDNLTEEAGDTSANKDELRRRVECIVSVLTVGVSCSNHLPTDRMKIVDAIGRLQSARDNLPNAKKRQIILQEKNITELPENVGTETLRFSED